MTVKVFGPFDRKGLGKEVQEWLDENPGVTIRFVTQSQDGTGWITVTIFYE